MELLSYACAPVRPVLQQVGRQSPPTAPPPPPTVRTGASSANSLCQLLTVDQSSVTLAVMYAEVSGVEASPIFPAFSIFRLACMVKIKCTVHVHTCIHTCTCV